NGDRAREPHRKGAVFARRRPADADEAALLPRRDRDLRLSDRLAGGVRDTTANAGRRIEHDLDPAFAAPPSGRLEERPARIVHDPGPHLAGPKAGHGEAPEGVRPRFDPRAPRLRFEPDLDVGRRRTVPGPDDPFDRRSRQQGDAAGIEGTRALELDRLL